MSAMTRQSQRRNCLWIGISGLMCLAVFRAQADPLPPLNVEQCQSRLDKIQAQIQELVPPDDILDSLHFGWSDRPYERATLAVLIKSASVLERELHLRGMGNGAIPDETVSRMIHWQQEALAHTGPQADVPGFRPHRLRVSDGSFDASGTTASLFGIVDASTMTHLDDRLGDLDLIAALGYRVYGWPDRARFTEADRVVQRRRSHALGMATVRLAASDRDRHAAGEASRESLLTVRPTPLADLVAGSPLPSGPYYSIGVSDPPFGESWASRLARDSLARTASMHRHFITAAWTPPKGDPSRDPGAIAPAMWLDAVEGQSLGLLAGWRDLRDGSADFYASVLPCPEYIQVSASTALDLIRLGRYVAAFRSMPRLALVIDGEAVDRRDGNAWARWIQPVWTALLQRQIPFDVTSENVDASEGRGTYHVVEHLHPDRVRNLEELIVSLENRLEHPDDGQERVTALESDGSLATSIVLRQGTGEEQDWCLMVANLSARGRQVIIQFAHRAKQVRDLISGEVLPFADQELPLAAWQVRVLVPL